MKDVLQENGQIRKQNYAAALDDILKGKKTSA